MVLSSCAILNGEKFMSINFNQNLRDGAMTDTVAIPDPILSVIKFFLKKKKKKVRKNKNELFFFTGSFNLK